MLSLPKMPGVGLSARAESATAYVKGLASHESIVLGRYTQEAENTPV